MRLQKIQRENEKKKKEKMEKLMAHIQIQSNIGQNVNGGNSGQQSLNHTTIQPGNELKVNGVQISNKSWFKLPTQREFIGGYQNDMINSSAIVGTLKHQQQRGGLHQRNISNTQKDKHSSQNVNQAQQQLHLQKQQQNEQNHQSLLDQSVRLSTHQDENFEKATIFVMRTQDERLQKNQNQPRIGQSTVGQGTNEENKLIEDIEFDSDYLGANQKFLQRKTSNFPDQNNQDEHDEHLQKLYERKRYVPVALVIETETEYHDTFRQILLALFDLIRVPTNYFDNKTIDNRTIAFAELISHLAFFKSIPAPSFNSIYHLHCLNQVFTIKESGFDQIPHKNQFPIKILFDVLDVRSIFYCWKALLFDKTLVLVSSQYSLQFYVAEALKQLLFPMTWQNTYIQPGNENLSGHADGTMVVIYGSNSMVNGFDFFDGMSPEMAVCDIDACFTNNIDLPCLPDEQMYIRILNMLKNSRINQYDKAYPDSQIIDSEDFVQQVKETFFGLLKPYLQKVEDYIDQSVDVSGAFFEKYFKIDDYLSHFENYGPVHFKFAQALVKSSQFVHFCDDFFSDELNNFQMLQDIFRSRGEINLSKENPFERKRSHIIENFNFEEYQQLSLKKGKSIWPENEPVVFNFRIPKDNIKVMLFEKMLFMIDTSMLKKEQDITRKTNEHLLQNKDHLHYAKIIQEIRQLYPNKMKFLLSRQQAAAAENQQNVYLQKLNMKSTVEQMHQQRQHQIGKQPQNLQQQSQIISSTSGSLKRRPLQKVQSSDSLQVVVVDTPENAMTRGGQVQRQSLVEAQQIPMRFIQSNQQLTPSTNNNNQERIVEQSYQGYQNVKMQLNFTNNPNSQTKIPLDLMNSQNEDMIGTSSYIQHFQHSMNENAFYWDEQERVQACQKRISKLMYGQSGLICFLNHLFGLMTEKQMREVNFYFSLREQLQTITEFQKKQCQIRKEKLKNDQIQEDVYEEDKTPSNRNDHSLDQKSPTTNQLNQRSRIYSTSKAGTFNPAAATNSTSTYSQKVFKSDKEWLNIEQWETQSSTLKGTYQFILFKTKIYEAFECPEDGYSLIWKELLKFPRHKMKFFPRTKFMNIWEKLTHSQQQELFIKLGIKQDKPCIQMISKDYLRSTASKSFSHSESFNSVKISDETLFQGASIQKSYAQKKKEKQQRDTLNKTRSLAKIDILSLTHNCSSSKKSNQRSTEQKNKKNQEKQLKNTVDRLKTRISQKLGNDSDLKKKSTYSNKICDPIITKMPLLSSRSHTQEEFSYIKMPNTPDNLTPKNKQLKMGEHSRSQFSRDFIDGGSTSGINGSGNSTTSKTFNSASGLKKQGQPFVQDYDLGIKSKKKETIITKMKDAEVQIITMLNKIIQFWKKKSKFVQKRGQFIESELPQIILEMEKFDKYLNYLKVTKPEIDSEIGKQAFFLNLFNFLVLYQLSVLMISSPEAVEKLTNYNMWQAFLVNARVKIAGHKISAYSIMHSILRFAQEPPKISQFLLNTPAIEFECAQFQVKEPSKLLSFGFYLPLKGMPKLRIYNSNDLENQLRTVAQEFLIKKVRIHEDFTFIMMPRFMKWYQKDFCEAYILDLLKFVENDVFQGKGSLPINKVLEKITSKKLSAHDIILAYKGFSFDFRPLKMAQYFPDLHDQPSNLNE